MTIELRDITRENFDAAIALAVAEDQRDFLNSNVECIAWAYVAEESRPFVIYSGDTPVGVATYGYIPADGRCWISHFMTFGFSDTGKRQGGEVIMRRPGEAGGSER
jgi:hypothetical protein